MNEDQMYDAAEREVDLYRAEITRITAERDKAQADRNSARNVVAEMADHWRRIGTTREEDELIPQWLKAAGLTS